MIQFIKDTYLWLLLVPTMLVGLGAASNQAVLIANHGKFPVMLNPVQEVDDIDPATGMMDREHCVMTKDTRLNALADIFPLGGEIFSLGDVALEAGQDLGPYMLAMWFALILLATKRG